MDDPGWSWPAWKFGMKKEDLDTKLHDQYNTFPSAIQDHEAFHHDVFEISNQASTIEEFHTLMAARKQQRLLELDTSLESAAFEIIAHPKLIGTEQWEYALQLFRSRSLDSLVRYFSSYLPSNYLQRHAKGYQTPTTVATSFDDSCSIGTASTKASTVDDEANDGEEVPVPTKILEDEDEQASFTQEPEDIHPPLACCSLKPNMIPLPLSPRSITAAICDTPISPIEAENTSHCDFSRHHHSPPRTLSFSGSESGPLPRRLTPSLTDDDETSQSEDDSPAVSEPDMSESQSSLDSFSFSGTKLDKTPVQGYLDDDEDFFPAQFPEDSFDDGSVDSTPLVVDSCELMGSETPTPRQETVSASYMDSKAIQSYRIRATSPKSQRHLRQREGSPLRSSRRSPEEVSSRIQKPLIDATRIRTVKELKRRRLEQ